MTSHAGHTRIVADGTPRRAASAERARGSVICHLLREDPELAEAVPPATRGLAIRDCIAPVERVPAGPWDGARPQLGGAAIGLLVLEGLMIRHVEIGGRCGAELLGDGDILRPWHGQDAPLTLPGSTGWRVLRTTRVAVLDERVARRLARYPELTGRLVGRALERSRRLVINMAIVSQPRVDVRLHMLFWHLADRWGQVTPGGVRVPLRLTHSLLADLVAARRQTVSTAIAELARSGLVVALDDQLWLLTGEPPVGLLTLGLGLPADTSRRERFISERSPVSRLRTLRG